MASYEGLNRVLPSVVQRPDNSPSAVKRCYLQPSAASQFQNNVLNATESRRFRYFPSLWRNNLPGMKVPMGTLPLVVKRPWLTVHSQPPKMQVKINRQKVSRCFKSYYFSWSWMNSGSYRISKLEKPVLLPKNTLSIGNTLTVPYNLLISENILKFGKWVRPRQPPKHIS